MRTSEDVRKSGLYASECCGKQLSFSEGDTFWRCPQCQHLCDWEPENTENLVRPQSAAA